MKRRTFVALAAATPALPGASAKDAALNGRWDITVPGDARKRAWWVEIRGAETAAPSGSFIGAPGGGLDKITDMKVDNGEARWSFYRPARNNNKEWRGLYKARIQGDKLEGSLEIHGTGEVTKWFGVRAPQFKPVDPASMKEGQPIELFNGRDLSGWKPVRENVPMKWTVEAGILKNAPGTTDIVSEQNFQDFKLHAEYRFGDGSNSGIGLRGRYEMQIHDDYGRPAYERGHGSIYSRIAPTTNAGRKPGEWQSADITLVGNRVSVVLNGTKIIDNKEIEGLTAIAIDPNEGEPGPFVIQGDHGAVEFRRFTVTPLLRR
jgi:hypothetical protein